MDAMLGLLLVLVLVLVTLVGHAIWIAVTPAEQPVAPPAAPSPCPSPRRPLSEMLAAFMEESNIRWGELVGGLRIVGCSLALIISLWSPWAGCGCGTSRASAWARH